MWKTGDYVRLSFRKYMTPRQPKPLCKVIKVIEPDKILVCSEQDTYYLQKETSHAMSVIRSSDLEPGSTVGITLSRLTSFQNLPTGTLCRFIQENDYGYHYSEVGLKVDIGRLYGLLSRRFITVSPENKTDKVKAVIRITPDENPDRDCMAVPEEDQNRAIYNRTIHQYQSLTVRFETIQLNKGYQPEREDSSLWHCSTDGTFLCKVGNLFYDFDRQILRPLKKGELLIPIKGTGYYVYADGEKVHENE